MTATRSSSSSSKPAAKPPLYSQHETFTHGGNFWRDNYLLERWARSEQPVVYLGDVYNNYELKLRLGDWCWLTQDPISGEYMTIKFLSRPTRSELYMSHFVSEHCRSPFVSAIKGSFKMPHYLAQTGPRYAGLEFDAVFYPLAGTDLRRICTPCEHLENPDIPLPPHRRMQCIRELVLGLAALHKTGVVHGDIHPENVALPPPCRRDIEHYLTTQKPPVHHVRRKDGTPTHPTLPRQVTEPVDIGFGEEGHITILDFGYSFRAIEGGSYSRAHFPRGTPLPPELVGADATTRLPFKVDSWHLGLCMFYILTDGAPFVQRGLGQTDESLRDQYEGQYAALADNESELSEWIPDDLREDSRPILMSLLCLDPARRGSVEELTRNKWLMDAH